MQANLIKKASSNTYTEIFQQVELRFSFLNQEGNDFYEQFADIKCRDYLSDVLMAEEHNVTICVYGFKYDPSESKIDRDATKLSLKFPSSEHKALFLSNIPNLHYLEDKAKYELTKVLETQLDNQLIVIGSANYLNTTPLLSLYSLLLRAMCTTWFSPWVKGEADFADSALQGWKIKPSHVWELFNKLTKTFDTQAKVSPLTNTFDNDWYSFHNNSGIASYLALTV